MDKNKVAMGVETEYGSSGDLSNFWSRFYTTLREAKISSSPGDDGHSGFDNFLSNGARAYQDGGHVEYCTPECGSPADIVRSILAGHELVRRATLGPTLPVPSMANSWAAKINIFRQNVDYNSMNTWGTHESYTTPIKVEAKYDETDEELPNDEYAMLLPHVATRLLYTGAGGLRLPNLEDGDGKGEGGFGLFSMSPRAEFFHHDWSEDTTDCRGLLDGREESYDSEHSRLHLICGESLCSNVAMFLKVATTSMAIRLVEIDEAPKEKIGVAHDLFRQVSRREPAAIKTAMRVQRRLLAAVMKNLKSMPEWAEEACGIWKKVLDRVESDEVSTLLDWGIKRALFDKQVGSRGFNWIQLELAATHMSAHRDSDRLADQKKGLRSAKIPGLSDRVDEAYDLLTDLYVLDRKFGMLNEGIFDALDSANVLDHKVKGVSLTSVSEPPKGGRAEVRGWLIGTDQSRWSDWNRVYFESDTHGDGVELNDPMSADFDKARAKLKRLGVKA